MSNYAPSVNFEIEFEGDKVAMKLSQLTRKTVLSWLPYMESSDETGKLTTDQTASLVNDAADIISQYITDFSGLKDVNGNAVPIDDVLSKAYFLPLVSQIVMRLMEISQIGKGAEGNLGGQSPAP